MSRKIVTIDDWWYDGTRLHGKMIDHPRYGSTEDICQSSPVSRIDETAGIAETKWTTYKLGKKREIQS